MNTTRENKVDEVANIIANKRVEFQVGLSDAETAATNCSITDTNHIASQLEREIYGIALNEQMHFKKELCICLIKFEACRKAISMQQFWKTIE